MIRLDFHDTLVHKPNGTRVLVGLSAAA